MSIIERRCRETHKLMIKLGILCVVHLSEIQQRIQGKILPFTTLHYLETITDACIVIRCITGHFLSFSKLPPYYSSSDIASWQCVLPLREV